MSKKQDEYASTLLATDCPKPLVCIAILIDTETSEVMLVRKNITQANAIRALESIIDQSSEHIEKGAVIN